MSYKKINYEAREFTPGDDNYAKALLSTAGSKSLIAGGMNPLDFSHSDIRKEGAKRFAKRGAGAVLATVAVFGLFKTAEIVIERQDNYIVEQAHKNFDGQTVNQDSSEIDVPTTHSIDTNKTAPVFYPDTGQIVQEPIK